MFPISSQPEVRIMQQTTAQKNTETQPQVSLINRILEYKNTEFIERLKEKLNIDNTEAEVLFVDMKQFLYLCGTRHGKWSPTPKIDAAWHEFILYTNDYMLFCNSMFGRFIHHTPRSYFGANTRGRTWATTQIAFDIFQNLSKNWDVPEEMRPQVSNSSISIPEIDPCGDHCGCSSACNGD